MRLNLNDDGDCARLTLSSSFINIYELQIALDLIRLVADVKVELSGILRRKAIVTGIRQGVLRAASVLQSRML
ncbi:hypothetical protein DQJ78_23570 [Salmonella enterica subsp. enterica serovar Newport]|nr:hypothetical protein [Salmonella enterica subsp. enterica serovar Newport]EBS2364609.1 hypothetical protein [Salmonella enterica subsp. enterica serovar Newport]EBS4398737.1 hypothetical protein [Salmonella enterica subsp. enterica serovar Newport]EBY9582638.1 hypothetical protein [Salmonella enterica subsp. enterica serovar Newport]